MRVREKVSQPVLPGVSAFIVLAAGFGAAVLFIWRVRPNWNELTPWLSPSLP